MNRSPAAPLMSERRVGILGAVLVAVGPASLALYTPAMPQIVEAFGSTEAAVKMTMSVYFAGLAVAQLICGPLSDGLGRKPITFIFMGIYAVASLIAVLSTSIEVLIGARFLQGVGAAVGAAISRAIVRDLYTHEQSAKIMNMIGIILAAAPALAPTIGGLIMVFFGWHAIFVAMLLVGTTVVLSVHFLLVETIERDLSRIRLPALISAYHTLIRSRYFMLSSLIIAGATGTMFAQATVLPFIIMDRVGLTPTEFGVGMILQSGMFFLGSLSMRILMKRISAFTLVPVGLAFIGLGSTLIAFFMNFMPLTFLSVMLPTGIVSYGIAYIMPAMMTASLAPFPKIAGSASALAGFLQMGAGLLGGTICAMIGDPVLAMGTVIPAMGFSAIVCWIFWRRLPEPEVPAGSYQKEFLEEANVS